MPEPAVGPRTSLDDLARYNCYRLMNEEFSQLNHVVFGPFGQDKIEPSAKQQLRLKISTMYTQKLLEREALKSRIRNTSSNNLILRRETTASSKVGIGTWTGTCSPSPFQRENKLLTISRNVPRFRTNTV